MSKIEATKELMGALVRMKPKTHDDARIEKKTPSEKSSKPVKAGKRA